MNKDEVFAAVQKRMLEWYGPFTTGGRCLYWMHTGLATLFHEFKILAQPAAGSAGWDWGDAQWEFIFGSEPDARTYGDPSASPLPEMHCWIYLPITQEVIDFSMCELAQTIRAITREDWNVKVPRYIWSKPEALHPSAIYIPNRAATTLAVAAISAGMNEPTT